MGKAEQRTKDSAMAATLLRGDGDPRKVAARKRMHHRATLDRIRYGGPGTAKLARRSR